MLKNIKAKFNRWKYNQQRPRKFKAKTPVAILCLVLLAVASTGYYRGSYYRVADSYAMVASEKHQVANEAARLEQELTEATAELEAIKAKYPDPKREEIEAYVRKIFGKDANTALAVSHHECGYTNKHYPRCALKSEVEHSVGLFQINLYNSKQWIHAGRIPGNTMAEKVQWLENPFNNTLYAYWVFKTSGFHPWTAFSKGHYLNDPLMK